MERWYTIHYAPDAYDFAALLDARFPRLVDAIHRWNVAVVRQSTLDRIMRLPGAAAGLVVEEITEAEADDLLALTREARPQAKEENS